MNSSLVVTILGPDRTGLVRALANVISEQGGSWQESRMARMMGQFAGILKIDFPEEKRDSLVTALEALFAEGLTVTFAQAAADAAAEGETVSIDITGLDEPGIVKRIASTLADLGVNVEELETSLESAAMAGLPLFCTRGQVRLPSGLSAAALIEALERVGAGLNVDVQ